MTREPHGPDHLGSQQRDLLAGTGWWPWFLALAAAWIAAVHGVLWWLETNPVPRSLWGDENTYLRSALRFGSGDPEWWPEALWPPLYPQFLAGLIEVGGGSLAIIVVVQSALLALTAVLLFDLTRRLTGSRSAGTVVAVVTLGYPPLAAFAHYLWPEVLHLFLFVAFLWILVARAGRPGWCSMAGVALGLALLSKSLLLPIAPLFLVIAVWRRPVREAVVTVMLVAALAVVTVAPTLAANARRTGSPSIANSATFNLWVGLNDRGRESFRHDVVWPEFQRWMESADTDAARDRILRSRIGELVRQRGFVSVVTGQLSKQYFRLFDAGCYLIDQLPGGAAQIQSGAGYLGAAPGVAAVVAGVTTASILALYLGASAGLILGGCRQHRWVRVLAIFVVYNLALFLWLHVKTRYRIQMLPAAFVGVGCLVAWVEAGCCPRPTRARLAALSVVIGFLMWFALG